MMINWKYCFRCVALECDSVCAAQLNPVFSGELRAIPVFVAHFDATECAVHSDSVVFHRMLMTAIRTSRSRKTEALHFTLSTEFNSSGISNKNKNKHPQADCHVALSTAIG